ncbi:MAG: DUF63 family protein [Halodesulfurarchaeum sp.]
MTFPETDVERTWTGVVLAILAVLVGGSLLFPDRVYGGFVWQYFWGPVYADAHSAACAAWNGGTPRLLTEATCATATGPVAYPGYTLVSEVGYAITLLLSLLGVVFLLRRLELGERTEFVVPLVPFILFGGALRVVEDANDALGAGTQALQYPWNTLIISPLIYFTVFLLTLASLVLAVWLERSGRVRRYEVALSLIGTVLFLGTLLYLGWLSVVRPAVEFHPIFVVLTAVFASLITGGLWWAIRTYLPDVARGTPRVGALVIFGQAVDGVSNVLAIDWGAELGLQYDLVPKHPVNRAIINWTDQLVPPAITGVIGTAWTFLLLKIVVATAVVGLFDEEMIGENPRFSVLLLLAIVAVGLGPGTRDALRATFGI